jgi:hypothetical protein
VAPEGRQQKGFGDLRLVHPWLDDVLEQPYCGVAISLVGPEYSAVLLTCGFACVNARVLFVGFWTGPSAVPRGACVYTNM